MAHFLLVKEIGVVSILYKGVKVEKDPASNLPTNLPYVHHEEVRSY